jgi:cell wall assembly regulator SMI1
VVGRWERARGLTPIAESWKRIAKWLKTKAPGWKPLKKGVTAAKVAAAEKQLGFKLPAELRESFLTYQGDDSNQIFPCADDISFYLMSFAAVVGDWKMMKELVDMGEFKDSDKRVKNDKAIRKSWWNAGWIPFAGNGGGDYFCVDLDPPRAARKDRSSTSATMQSNEPC